MRRDSMDRAAGFGRDCFPDSGAAGNAGAARNANHPILHAHRGSNGNTPRNGQMLDA